MTDTQTRILIALSAALVVVLAAILGVLLFRGDDEPAAAPSLPAVTATTEPAPTTAPPTTTEPTTATTTSLATTTTSSPTTTSTTSTTSSTSTTSTTTTTQPDPCAFMDDLAGPIINHVFLDVDGIGAVTMLGDAPSVVIQRLTCLLGEPDADTGWVDSFSVFGVCPGSEVRGVTWGPLTTLFGDGPTGFAPEGTRHFYNWFYDAGTLPDALELVFPETRIGLGSTVAEVQAAYPGANFFAGEPEAAFPPGFTTFDGIFGTFTGDGDDDTVTYLSAGAPCGE